jgi:hypothetical protein
VEYEMLLEGAEESVLGVVCLKLRGLRQVVISNLFR